MSNSKYKNKLSSSKFPSRRLGNSDKVPSIITVLTSNSLFFFLTGRQITPMMRLKSHFQIIQNIAQVTNFLIILICHKIFNIVKFPKIACTRAIKTIYIYYSKYVQKLCTNCESYIVNHVQEILNSKQQLSFGMFEFRDRNWGTVCCVKLWDNYTIYKPQSACNKQTKKKTTE